VILVDTSVWVDHFRRGDVELAARLNQGEVLMHPFVLGEIALGSLRRRKPVLNDLSALPQTKVASDDEVLMFIERHRLSGTGIGWVDAHLLGAVQLTDGARLWTRDRRLHGIATRMGTALDTR
jgi:predicted nucleic acid-binding protein